jgi:oxygen-independent coproporphyrinogen-3 oxidase
MLRTRAGAVRWANTDDLGRYEDGGKGLDVLGAGGQGPEVEVVAREQGFEEAMFLGLRMNEGVELGALRTEFGEGLLRGAVEALGDVVEAGLVEVAGGRVRLTGRGRMVSNEVFSRLLGAAAV